MLQFGLRQMLALTAAVALLIVGWQTLSLRREVQRNKRSLVRQQQNNNDSRRKLDERRFFADLCEQIVASYQYPNDHAEIEARWKAIQQHEAIE